MRRLLVPLLEFAPLLFLLLGCQPAAPETDSARQDHNHTLTYQWARDASLQFRFDLSQEIDITAGPRAIQNYTRILQNYRLISNGNSGDAELSLTMAFGDIDVSMKDEESEGRYNSASSDPPRTTLGSLLQRSLGRIPKQEITIQILRGNRIGKITNLDAVLESMTRQIPSTLKNMIFTIYGEDRIRQLIYLTPLPSGKLIDGFAWPIQETRRFALLGPTELDGIAKLVNQETRNGKSLFQIEISGKARKGATQDDLSPQPYSLEQGTFQGRAWFDPEIGQYSDSILTYKLDVSSTPASLNSNETPLSIQVTQKYATKLLSSSPTTN